MTGHTGFLDKHFDKWIPDKIWCIPSNYFGNQDR